MSSHDQPIACSLPARESRDQIGEWRALVEHQTRLERVDGGYAVTFDAAVTPVVEDLARRESACCGFLDIDSRSTEDGVRLLVTSSSPDALAVIELLVGLQD